MDQTCQQFASAIKLLSAENQKTLRQLCDMFSGISPKQIREVCEQNLWNVELCIDNLISADNGEDKNCNRFSEPAYVEGKNCTERFHFQQGAIPKNFTLSLQETYTTAENRNILQNKTINTNKKNTAVDINSNKSKFVGNDYKKILQQIASGHKIMILMRGAPGCGKTYLARTIVKQSLPPESDSRDFIFSSDDFFFDSCGRYKYNVYRLEEAHCYNHKRVQEKAAAGWSPIIVDNTNIKLWEMLPYVQTAVRYGYILEMIEPKTPWCHSAGKLSMKNRHHVPRDKIQSMLDKFEKGNPLDLLKLMKDTKYTVPLPQLRRYPLLTVPPEEMEAENLPEKKILNELINEQQKSIEINAQMLWGSYCTNSPKEQRSNQRKSRKIAKPNLESTEEIQGESLLQGTISSAWKPYEQEACEFWATSEINNLFSKPIDPLKTEESEKSLLELLKEGVKSAQNLTNEINSEYKNDDLLKRHKVGCINESKSFCSLRQIYPNKQVSELWDLYLKCNGNVDWVVDILLKDEDCVKHEFAFEVVTEENKINLDCDCDIPYLKTNSKQFAVPSQIIEESYPSGTLAAGNGIKPQRQHRIRTNKWNSEKEIKVMGEIQNLFVLGDEHYSKNVKKVRSKRYINSEFVSEKTFVDVQVQTDSIIEENDENDYDKESEVLEINLGENIINQLSNIFQSETYINGSLPENYKTNVFMPKSLAKELYVLWMESVYYQIEEQRLINIREDEDFARLLKNPKYEHFKKSPDNLNELLDMELALFIYKNENEEREKKVESNENHRQLNDLASQLTQMNLCDIFPNIPKETLLEILAAHNNNFSETIEVLQRTFQPNKQEIQETTLLPNQLEIKASIEHNKLLKGKLGNHGFQVHSIKKEEHLSSNQDVTRNNRIPHTPDEAKRLALGEFEETRNFAAHHSQLKAECYQKAKEAIQKGNSAVAVYYSQIANLHKKKIDIYNHRAANCIMEVHNLTQNNPDLIDLHYLHVMEAIGCLDLFIDKHIANLRIMSRIYKYVFIITGRGLHSAGGVSTIKNKVKSRLKDRNLRWSEVNPGLLKVKIFSASRFSKNM